MAQVVDIRLHELEHRLKANKKLKLAVDEAAKTWLASAGFNPSFGARPLARVIQQELLFPLSKMILEGSVREGETAFISADPVANRIVIQKNHEPEVEMVDEGSELEDTDLEDEEHDGFDRANSMEVEDVD